MGGTNTTVMTTAVEETTPLLGQQKQTASVPKSSVGSVTGKLLFAGFIITLSFGFTQVPILYVFRVMVCDDYYRHNPSSAAASDRCSRNEVDAGTAAQLSILGITTTLCGVVNLFFTGWQIRTWGPKTSLLVQTFFPALRVAIQGLGVVLGGKTGIVTFQMSQLWNIIGGPGGYLLVLNTAIGEVVEPSKRTGAFGQLQGSVMMATAIGFLAGGLLGDAFGLRRPFEVSFVFFVISCLYIGLVMPYIDPPETPATVKRGKSWSGIFGPLKVLGSQKLLLQDGRPIKHYGTTFLASGIFLGVLATGYAPMLIQMYATAQFDFHPTQNGYLMSVNFCIRGFFLLFIFPKIISSGRRWFASSTNTETSTKPDPEGTIPTAPEDFDPVPGVLPEQEPTEPPNPVDEDAGRGFDLFFLRWSLVVDAFVTAYTAFATQGWHIYVAGFLLPLASGSAPAAKGVITEMCRPSKRADALQAMTLVETVAMLSTLTVFGFVFAVFSDIGKAYLTFYCNAAVAFVSVGVLLFCRFPSSESTYAPEDCVVDPRPAEEITTE